MSDAAAAPAKAEQRYFAEYGAGVHELMLRDKPRTETYARALAAAAEHVRGRVVLDVGAGSGILSLLAARLGARRVVAVEASPFASVLREIVAANGLGDVVEVVQARVEDVAELPGCGGELADVLVSEWMGFALLHEGMLQSVLSARDRLLKPGGLMLPRRAELFVAPTEMAELRGERVDFWADVYGFDMSPVMPHAVAEAAREALTRAVPASEVMAAPSSVARLDLREVRAEQLAVIYGEHEFVAPRAGVLGGFTLHFVVEFEGGPAGEPPVALSTAPDAPPTHWKQTSVLLPAPVRVSEGDRFRCAVTVAADPDNERLYEISVDLLGDGDGGGGAGGGGDDDCDITFGEHPRSCDCLQCVLTRAAWRDYEAKGDDAEMRDEA